MKQTIAQFLNIKEFPFEIKNKAGSRIYYEDSDGYWFKSEYNENENEIYFEDSNGHWYKSEYSKNGNRIYLERFSNEYWYKKEYNENGNMTYFKDSNSNVAKIGLKKVGLISRVIRYLGLRKGK